MAYFYLKYQNYIKTNLIDHHCLMICSVVEAAKDPKLNHHLQYEEFFADSDSADFDSDM